MPCFDWQIEALPHTIHITIYNKLSSPSPSTSPKQKLLSHPSMEDTTNNSPMPKRKRSKRQRPHLSPPDPSPSPHSAQFHGKATEEEEEDMANCLLLLSKRIQKPESNRAEQTTNDSIHICKTCGKCFASYQALGGHRASHKRQKLSASSDEAKKNTAVKGEDSIRLSMNSLSPQVAAMARVHKCSICGAEYISGQALGGHMRRHRAASLLVPEKKKRKSNGFIPDLNLPAPCDDEGDLAKFSLFYSLERNAQILALTSSL